MEVDCSELDSEQIEFLTLKVKENENEIKYLEEKLNEKEVQLQEYRQHQKLLEFQIQTLEEINHNLRSRLSIALQQNPQQEEGKVQKGHQQQQERQQEWQLQQQRQQPGDSQEHGLHQERELCTPQEREEAIYVEPMTNLVSFESKNVLLFNGERFQKVPGTANDKGLMFEMRMALLLSLRCLSKGKQFQLASNISGVGKFDDIVLQAEGTPTMCLQLKHTQSAIRHSEIFSFSGRFSLLTYFISYRDEVLKNLGEYCNVIIYTNANMDVQGLPNLEEKFLKSSKDGRSFCFSEKDEEVYQLHSNFVKYRKFLNAMLEHIEEFSEFNHTSYIETQLSEFESLNSILPFSYRLKALKRDPTKENILKHLKEAQAVGDLTMYPRFLQKLKVFCKQADVKELETVIRSELEALTGVSDNEDMFAKLAGKIKDWWSNSEGYYLTEKNPIWKEVIMNDFGKLSANKLGEVISYNIRLNESSVQHVRHHISNTQILHLFVDGECTALATCKTYQALHGGRKVSSIIMSLRSALVNRESVLKAWQSQWGRVLVLEANETGLQFTEMLCAIKEILKNHHDKTLVMITNINDLETISQVRALTGDGYLEYRDKISLSDLTEETQNNLLRTYVTFQGYEVPFGKLVCKHEDLKMDISGVVLMKLLKKKYIKIGEDIPEPIDYYITRILRRKEESLFAEDPADFKDRVIVVTGEPGMGKSTLLTYLAKQIKEKDPFTWVVRVNISDHTSYLERIKNNYIKGESTIEFLRSVARTKQRSDAYLDECIVNYCWQTNGGMTLLMDGFDEICPMYETLVINIVQDLLHTQIDKIWITSRLVCKEAIEKAANTVAFSLNTFTERDAHNFLKKMWTKGDYYGEICALDNFINKVLGLVSSSLNDTEKSFTGIPLQTLFISEMFEDKLQQYIATKQDNLPSSIDIQQMYEEFFRRKCKINYEKRGYDITKKGVKDDFEAFVKEAENIHKACALVTILLPNDLENLSEDVESRVKKFLTGVKQGNDLIGVIQSVEGGKPVFIHRTFAEYFVAKWFSENYQENRFVIGRIVQRPNFYMVNGMLNRTKSKGFELQMAIINNDKNTFTTLLTPDRVNQIDHGNRTALHLAAGFQAEEYFTRCLLDSGADPSMKDEIMQWTAMRYADAAKNWYAIELILRKGGDVSDLVATKSNIVEWEYIRSAIRACCEYGFDILLGILCQEGVNVNIPLDADNHTPLHIAATSAFIGQEITGGSEVTSLPFTESKYILDLLLKHGADVNAKTSNGSTVLHLLAKTGNVQLVQYIIERTMDESEEELRSGTERLFGVLKGQKDKMYTQKVLTQHRDSMDQTARDVAHRRGNLEVAKYLDTTPFAVDSFLSDENALVDNPCVICAVHFLVELRNADIHAKDDNKQTPLHLSAAMGGVNVVKYLVAKGANTNVRDKNGNTPLHISSENAKLQVVTFLLDECANSCDVLSKDNKTPLHKACMVGSLNVVKLLVSKGAKTNMCDVFGDTPLHVSVENGHLNVVKYLVEHCSKEVSINKVGGGDMTPLHIACSRGHLNIAKYLVHKGAEIDIPDEDGNTELHIAADKGHLNVLKFLVEKCGKDPNLPDDFNMTSLFKACRGGHLDVAQYLVEHGADAGAENKEGDTALHVSAFKGKMNTVMFLIEECGIDPNIRGNHQWTPLHNACVEGHLEVAKYLVTKAAETGASDKYGNTPLHVSAFYGTLGVVEFLCRESVDGCYTRNLKGRIPLHEACRGGHLDVTKYLAGVGVETIISDNNGDIPLIVAAEYGRLRVVAFLIEECGNKPHIKNYKGMTALHKACAEGNLNIVQYLCMNGCLTDARDENGCTPLHASSEQGKLSVVAFLLEECDNDPNVQDNDNMTPLHKASMGGHLDVVTYLIKKHQVDKYLKTSKGETALDLAREGNHKQIVGYLLSRTKTKIATHVKINKFLEK